MLNQILFFYLNQSFFLFLLRISNIHFKFFKKKTGSEKIKGDVKKSWPSSASDKPQFIGDPAENSLLKFFDDSNITDRQYSQAWNVILNKLNFKNGLKNWFLFLGQNIKKAIIKRSNFNLLHTLISFNKIYFFQVNMIMSN